MTPGDVDELRVVARGPDREGVPDRPDGQTSAPPPKEKKDKKKLDAAKAIDRPNTICTSRRKPPDVSPKARLSPVTMMMITATILATGPSMLSRIDWSGASQGIDDPPAWAGPERAMAMMKTAAPKIARSERASFM